MLRQENYETILIERRPTGVVVATLNRPERLNAVGGPMHFEMAQLSRDFDADSDARVLLITGAGRAFSSWEDFGGKDAGESKSPTYVNKLQEARQVIDNLIECSKPVMAAVNGYAMGLGAAFALACDVVVAGKSAVFADTHVKNGPQRRRWRPGGVDGTHWAASEMVTDDRCSSERRGGGADRPHRALR